jgi:hypothetical protein
VGLPLPGLIGERTRGPALGWGCASLRARLARLRSHLCDSPAASALLQALRSPVSRPSRCGVALRITACRLAEEALCRSATGGPERRSHNSRRKARVARCAGGRERPASLRCGRRAGRGEPRWLPGAGGRGMTRRLRPERGERWASFRRRRQQSRRRDAWRAGAMYIVGRRACAGCGLSHQGAETSGAARARSLCCPARSPLCAISRRAGAQEP